MRDDVTKRFIVMLCHTVTRAKSIRLALMKLIRCVDDSQSCFHPTRHPMGNRNGDPGNKTTIPATVDVKK